MFFYFEKCNFCTFENFVPEVSQIFNFNVYFIIGFIILILLSFNHFPGVGKTFFREILSQSVQKFNFCSKNIPLKYSKNEQKREFLNKTYNFMNKNEEK